MNSPVIYQFQERKKTHIFMDVLMMGNTGFLFPEECGNVGLTWEMEFDRRSIEV